jgi:DNA polymerase V
MIGQRIKAIRSHYHLNQLDFSSKLGISQSFLSTVERDEQVPGGEVILALKRYYPNVSAEWLLTGDGEMFLTEGDKKKINQGALVKKHKGETPLLLERRVSSLEQQFEAIQNKIDSLIDSSKFDDAVRGIELPYYPSPVAAGIPNAMFDEHAERLRFDKFFVKRPTKSFAIKCIGDSMTGAGIESGDILVVEKEREVQSGKVALVQLNGNEMTIKRIEIRKGGEVWLMPANTAHRAIQLTEENEAVILGIVVLVVRVLL